MPPAVTLYDGKTCKPKASYGNSSRNTVEWDPFGRFLMSGGFGNMMGDIDIWHAGGGQTKPIGQTRVNCTVIVKWSPCGRYFLCASTFPRRKMDNFVSIRYYDCMEIEKFDQKSKVDCLDPSDPDSADTTHFKRDLFSAFWRPVAAGTYEDRKPTPLKQRWTAAKHEEVKVNPPKPTGVYRPPGSQGHSSFAQEIRDARGEGKELKVAKLTAEGKPADEIQLIPGMSAAQAKALNKQNKKSKKGAEEM
eukprot:GDKJ01052499.1.p1 GENE.GDKJ01052499.1~~GDKJ01052499.1.p1  ORF type:complete len:248 (-),score=51.23 GDKJ01052499.1:78-821(-)